jgi:hypothetical protein
VEQIVKAVRRAPLAILTVLMIAGPTVAVPSAGAQTEPSLRIVPSPTTAGNMVTAFGAGFCAAPACPAVVLNVGGRIAATATVDPTGTFSANFRAPTIPNQYVVTADQAANPPMRATTGLLVVASDVPPTSPTSGRSPSTTGSSRPASDSLLPGSKTTTTTITTATRNSGTSGQHASGSDTGLVVLLTVAAAALAALLTGLWLRRRHRS